LAARPSSVSSINQQRFVDKDVGAVRRRRTARESERDRSPVGIGEAAEDKAPYRRRVGRGDTFIVVARHRAEAEKAQ
jgi:hypothetical protein